MSSSCCSSSSLRVSKAESGDVLEGLKVNGYVAEIELVTTQMYHSKHADSESAAVLNSKSCSSSGSRKCFKVTEYFYSSTALRN